MNPFERLRQVIDKVDLGYTVPVNQTQTAYRSSGFQQTKEYQPAYKEIEIARVAQISQNRVRQNQDPNRIRQLQDKIERLTQQLKKSELIKDQIDSNMFKLQKQNENLRELVKKNQTKINNSTTQDRQRRYRQEIARLNSTIQEMGTQLTNQHAMKKSFLRELEDNKKNYHQSQNIVQKKNRKLLSKIDTLQTQIKQRISMFEYNVKKNTEERVNTKEEQNKKISQLQQKLLKQSNQLQCLNRSMYELKNERDTHRLNSEHIMAKNNELQKNKVKLQHQLEDMKIFLNNKNQQFTNLQRQKQHLQCQLTTLGLNLQQQKDNVKVKVVEVRDKTVQMELQMYKKQCKQLLQEKAIEKNEQNGFRYIEP